MLYSPAESARTKLATAHRARDPQRIANARSELAVANIAAAIDRALATAPPLTDAQADALAVRLRATDR